LKIEIPSQLVGAGETERRNVLDVLFGEKKWCICTRTAGKALTWAWVEMSKKAEISTHHVLKMVEVSNIEHI
jgi:hypothetical protein